MTEEERAGPPAGAGSAVAQAQAQADTTEGAEPDGENPDPTKSSD